MTRLMFKKTYFSYFLLVHIIIISLLLTKSAFRNFWYLIVIYEYATRLNEWLILTDEQVIQLIIGVRNIASIWFRFIYQMITARHSCRGYSRLQKTDQASVSLLHVKLLTTL
jgi:hypothetical protein